MSTPHVVMVVGNDVTRDSRVKKSAASIALAGARVTVVGMSPTGIDTVTRMGDVVIRHVPLDDRHRRDRRGSTGLSKRDYLRDRRRLLRDIEAKRTALQSVNAQVRETQHATRRSQDAALDRELARALESFEGESELRRQQRLQHNEATAQRVGDLKQRHADWRTNRAETPPQWLDRVASLTARAGVSSVRVGHRARMAINRKALDRARRQLEARRAATRAANAAAKEAAASSFLEQRETLMDGATQELEDLRTSLRELDGRWRAGREAEPEVAELAELDWRDELATLMDMQDAYLPVLAELAPDVIHAHDVHVIGIAAMATRRRARDGAAPVLVYDAHEFVPGMALKSPRRLAAYVQLEREFIGDADAVITVSEPLAELLRRDHDLDGDRCRVVLNAPLVPEADTRPDIPSLRETVGLADDASLVVYSGGATEARGLIELVDAIALLPSVHLAIVSNLGTEFGRRLLRHVAERDLGGRVHTAPMVASEDVPAYLSSADLGIHPLRAGFVNHEIALPNKLFEYLHAGIPIVSSDVAAMSDFVRRHDVGEVFASGDAVSLADAITRGLQRHDAIAAGLRDPERLRTYSWQTQANALVALYRDLGILDEPLDQVDLSERMRSQLRDTGTPRRSRTALLAGPRNHGARLSRLAEAFGPAELGIDAFDVQAVVGTPGSDDADIRVGSVRLGRIAWQTQHLRRVVERYSHVLSEDGESLFGGLNGGRLEDDLPMLRAHDILAAAVLSAHDDLPTRIRQLREHGVVLLSFDAAVAAEHGLTWLPEHDLPDGRDALEALRTIFTASDH